MELSDLPNHARLIEQLRLAVVDDDRWRWLELSCSLAAGRGDRWSDIDVGIGHDVADELLRTAGLDLVERIGSAVDVLVHADPAWPDGILRFAVEYSVALPAATGHAAVDDGIGIQLDLVFMPAGHRPGLPDGSQVLVDKDDHLSTIWTPPVARATAEQAREWTMLGWWALSNVAKYLQREARYEAVAALEEARTQTLRVFAAARAVPYPAFGLTTLLDAEPAVLPDRLDATYAAPDDPDGILAAAFAIVELLTAAADEAGVRLERDLSTPWATTVVARLGHVGEQPLRGGLANAGRVVRDGPHVLRPATDHTESIAALLRALRGAGFDGVPMPIGIDDDGRERLEFIAGDVAVSPYPDWSQSDAALASIGRLVRRYHDTVAQLGADLDVGLGTDAWNDALADPRGGTVVCHNDLELSNIVFRNGEAVALIDFEFAAPGRPIYDLAHLARLCVPIEHEVDRERMGWGPADHPARLRLLADAYGLGRSGRHDLLGAIDDALERIEAAAHAGFGADPTRAAAMAASTGGLEKYGRRRRWWSRHRHRFEAALV